MMKNFKVIQGTVPKVVQQDKKNGRKHVPVVVKFGAVYSYIQ